MRTNQFGFTLSRNLLWLLVLINTIGLGYIAYGKINTQTTIPDLVGTWSGPNVTVSEVKGYKEWDKKTIVITEQKDRRFRGTLTYADGTKNFYGVIYPDNISFTWVSRPSKGFVHGRMLSTDKMGACYLEAYEEGTAGCATLEREEGH